MKITRILFFISTLLFLVGCGKSQNQVETFTVNGVSFKMVKVEGGTFQMGATLEQGNDLLDDVSPVHSVTLNDYYIGETEVTQVLWEAVMGDSLSQFKSNKNPVEQVSWNDCQEFIKKLNQLTGKQFRLPTEAEWEFAARGGNKSKGCKYAGSDDIDGVAWYGEAWYTGGTHPVAQKKPNELGLYDMSGNVWEWCNDWYGEDYYGESPSSNPKGPSTGESRVLRGGGWFSSESNCRVSIRIYYNPDNRGRKRGLRLAL